MKKEIKNEIKNFPKEVVALMLERQEGQGNKRDISVFKENKGACKGTGGFTWRYTPEGHLFWDRVITKNDFDMFFNKYPPNIEKENTTKHDASSEKSAMEHDILLKKIKEKVEAITTLSEDLSKCRRALDILEEVSSFKDEINVIKDNIRFIITELRLSIKSDIKLEDDE